MKIDNRQEYIANSVNPIFGRMFELRLNLPLQKDLCIRVKDHDVLGSDDIIGETWIDLENRINTKYRATCGLPLKYYTTGHNCWRDSKLPSQILHDICKKRKLNYKLPTNDLDGMQEQLCLNLLHELNLIPEHVETRRLFNSVQPDIEQGRLQMWIDIFLKSEGLPGSPVDITPRKPQK